MSHENFLIYWHFLSEENLYQSKHRYQDDETEENKWESDLTCWKMKSEADDELLS